METCIHLLVVLLAVTLFSIEDVSGERPPGFHPDDDVTRKKRSVDDGNDGARLPQQQSPFLMSSNLQASYFLGQCVMCPPGNPGPRGAPGPQGMPGRDGRDQLIIGTLGGQTVPERPERPTPRPDDGPSTRPTGVTYVRWGKTTCPSTSELVYEGIMGSGNQHTQKGSGVNYLCLPGVPTFGNPPNSAGGGAYVYGVEYENNLPTSPGIAQSEAPCAVCLAPSKGTALVVPGTNECLGSQDWTLEYQGYMMSSHYVHFKSEFVCIDGSAEGIPRTNHNNNQVILYLAEIKCGESGGGLPCPPYVDGNDLLCAVCTI